MFLIRADSAQSVEFRVCILVFNMVSCSCNVVAGVCVFPLPSNQDIYLNRHIKLMGEKMKNQLKECFFFFKRKTRLMEERRVIDQHLRSSAFHVSVCQVSAIGRA